MTFRTILSFSVLGALSQTAMQSEEGLTEAYTELINNN